MNKASVDYLLKKRPQNIENTEKKRVKHEKKKDKMCIMFDNRKPQEFVLP